MQISLRRLFFGKPLPTEHAVHERLSIPLALPIFASDALSSVAYATEAILIQFADANLSRNQFFYSIPIGIGIVSLILMVVVSYWQIIYAYPSGGGSYIVAKENLGVFAGLVAAASLLVDYVLTAAVSIAESVAAALSALSHLPIADDLEKHKVWICVALVLVITFLNLRGARESGFWFAAPSYLFLASMFGLIAWGLTRTFLLGAPPVENVQPPSTNPVGNLTGALTLLLVLRAFSSGCSALTGIEAVSNGVQAFKKPEAKNASLTLAILGALLAIIFTSLTILANRYGIVPSDHLEDYGGAKNTHETVVSQVARATFGTGIPYYVIQAATALILFLAANTSFAGFPRLASILAEDGYLPRQLANLGERLAFNNGILALAVLAIGFIVAFSGETHALLPLYTVGVFIAFTVSQAGMVVRWRKQGVFGWQLIINAVGCVLTATVLVVVLISKFWVMTDAATLFTIGGVPIREGAWIALALMGLLILMFRAIHMHYERLTAQLAAQPPEAVHPINHTVIVLVPSRLHRGVMLALDYARSISPDALAVHIAFDPEKAEQLRELWNEYGGDMSLLILNSPYRSLVGPLTAYLDAADKIRSDDIITVVLPEFVPAQWWHQFLHNASGLILRRRLFQRRDTVVVNVRYYLEE